jgi:DNA-binding transcriptional ArsR family regulator
MSKNKYMDNIKILDVFKALSDKNRLRMVMALVVHSELCACQLTELIQVTGATASRHMGVLIGAGLVQSRKEGRWVHYRLCRETSSVNALIHWIETYLSHNSDLTHVIEQDRDRLEAILREEPEVLCRHQRGEACCPIKPVD